MIVMRTCAPDDCRMPIFPQRFLFSSRNWGKWSNLTTGYFFEMGLVQPETRIVGLSFSLGGAKAIWNFRINPACVSTSLFLEVMKALRILRGSGIHMFHVIFVKVWLFVFVSRWWFQIQYMSIFTPDIWGRWFEKFDGRAYFSEWVGEKPPPTWMIQGVRIHG